MKILYTLMLLVIGLSLDLAVFLIVFFTVRIVLRPISSSLRLMLGIPPGMLCEHDWVLYAGPSLKDILILGGLIWCFHC